MTPQSRQYYQLATRACTTMVNLSWVLERIFELHGSIPRLLWPGGRAFSPVHMLIEVTYRCNLRCNFCQYLPILDGRQQPQGPVQRDLDRADILRWVDEFPRGRLITFAGGEPWARKDFLEILEHAARRHRVHIITNGGLIHEHFARACIELAPRHLWQNGLVLLEVSLQGLEEIHDRVTQRTGSWRRAVQAVRHLVRLRAQSGKAFPKLDLKMVITRDTVGDMVGYVHLASELGVELVNFLAEHDLKGNSEGEQPQKLWRPQRPPDGVDPAFLRRQLIECFQLAEKLELQLRLTPNVPIDEFVRHYRRDRTLSPAEYRCEGVWSRIGITADGRPGTVCPYFATGDMRKLSLRESWNGAPLRQFRAAVRSSGVFPGCHGCCNLKYVGSKRFGLAGVSV